MEEKNEELEKDLQEQYAILEEEKNEDKKKRRTIGLFVVLLLLFLIMFGTTFSYIRIYDGKKQSVSCTALKNLYIEGYEDAFEFNANIHRYVLRVKKNTTSVDVRYVLGCQGYKVEITGADNLKPGDNEVKVTVILEDGSKEEYIIDVIVDEEPTPKPTPTPNPNPTPNPDPTPTPTPTDGEDDNSKKTIPVGLKDLKVSRHELDREFKTEVTNYIVDGIKNTEDSVLLNYVLLDPSNKTKIIVNGTDLTSSKNEANGKGSININVNTYLDLGSNKVEIIVYDDDNNEVKYTVFLVVSEITDPDDQPQVIEIIVDYGAYPNGQYLVENIVPGWDSTQTGGNQAIKVTNGSNYNQAIKFKWTNVDNRFNRKEDLLYTLYKGDTEIASGTLPAAETEITTSSPIIAEANTVVTYYIKYSYKYYKDVSQNVDQGSTFKANVSVVIAE